MNARFLPYARENRPTRQVIEHFNRHGIIIGPNIAAWSITFGFLGNAYGMREFWRVWDQLPNAGMRMSFFATVAICPRSRGHLDREYRNYANGGTPNLGCWLQQRCNLLHIAFATDATITQKLRLTLTFCLTNVAAG